MSSFDNPVPGLLALYRRIHAERMGGLPFLNSRLEVDVLEFRQRDGRWSGLLITPWFINFVIFPKTPDEWGSLEPGTRIPWNISGKQVELVADFEPEIGHYQMHTLRAPVTEFSNQEQARDTARYALERLFEPAAEPAAAAPARSDGHYRSEQERPAREVSRRGFFRSFLKR